MHKLLRLLENAPEFAAVSESLENGIKQQLIYGLSGSQRSYLLAALRARTERPVLVICPDRPQGERLCADFAAFSPEDKVVFFPANEIMSFELLAESYEVRAQRLDVLERLGREENIVVVAPVKALFTRLTPPAVFRSASQTLTPGQILDLTDLIAALAARGYERAEMVERRGQFSVRGGIIDVYPPAVEQPYRIEFFGDEIDSIRTFDPFSQRSLENSASLRLGPASELVLTPEVRLQGIKALSEALERRLKRLRDINKKNDLRRGVEGVLEKLGDNFVAPGQAQYLPYFYPGAGTFFDYLADDAFVFFDEVGQIREAARAAEMLMRETFIGSLEAGRVLPEQMDLYATFDGLSAAAQQRQTIYSTLLLRQIPQTAPERIVNFVSRPLYAVPGKFTVLQEEINGLLRKDYRVIIATGTAERAVKLTELLAGAGMKVYCDPDLAALPSPGQAAVTVGSFEAGFDFPSLRLALITDAEVIARPKRRPRRAARAGRKELSLSELRSGDYVVHVNHGIGRFLGVKTLTIDGVGKDYVFIQYAGADRLYIPVDQIGQVQKYVGAEGQEPKISKLGGSEWMKAKSAVTAAVEEMAEELLNLYAVRQSQPGFRFSGDTVWQKEFEAKFPYEETADQLQAVGEIKADMEQERPMDRLLCGDVGYGKTEVAVRAAFKAVMDSKQVAVLVPTTILAQQHYNTFRERFADYPVTIAMLSRFCSQREQKRTLRSLSGGAVDIVIGTHRLIQEDVRFKELGLVIVDEEQRFGVAHKERLKRLRQNVDVLTLTATPIPRTMQMSLVGLRDMSVINEPPEDRYPVQTYVMEYDEALVRDAILRETDRGGQVYFVHNAVQTIDKVARHIQKLVPEARIAVGHGQMKEEELEKVMLEFIEGEVDILVCTTIVETGLDIPNVNTLIVDNADHFGLSQLYQLRGRVGRTNRLAAAYFLYRRDKVLTEVAEKRLQTIKEFTEFGSGYKIALRDLEIRGAGNLLGPEQHGHLLAVGFELYCQMLEEAIRKAKGIPVEKTVEPVIELPLAALLPDTYVSDGKQKIGLYKKIAATRSEADVDDILDEMQDRFGDLPPETLNLLTVARLRTLARTAGIASVIWQRDRVILKFAPDAMIDGEKLWHLVQEHQRNVILTAAKKPFLSFRSAGAMPETLRRLLNFMRRLKDCAVCAGSEPGKL
jgi:transcription-repair coupling factor (superfamily II helicase)